MEFRLFGFPIHVNPFFLLIAVYIGYINAQQLEDDILAMAIGAAIVFVGVLAHELGHAFAGRSFGLTPRIDLHGFGGLTSWRGGRHLTPGRSIAVSFAGPLVGIVLGGPVLVYMLLIQQDDPITTYTLRMFVFVNLGWGILNLLPMQPLDGGNIMASFFELFSKAKGRLAARYVSLVIAVLIAGIGLWMQDLWITVLVGFMVWNNFQALRAERQIAGDMPLLDELRELHSALERGDANEVVRRAQELRVRATTPAVRAEVTQLLAWGFYIRRDLEQARATLESLPAGREPEPALYGAVLVDLGEPGKAIEPLEAALARGPNPFVDEKLAAALIASRSFDYAAEIYGRAHGKNASPESIAAVAAAAQRAGETEAAASLTKLGEGSEGSPRDDKA